MLAAAGVTTVSVHARPRVTIFSTGDEVVPPETGGAARRARSATRPRRRWPPWWPRRAASPVVGGIVPDDPRRAGAGAARRARASDLIVISAGSSVGTRDETAGVVGRLGEPGIWCHGLAVKPGKPTLLAECGGVPVIGLPGNPRSALVVFRLLGVPLVRLVGGCTVPPPEPADAGPARPATWRPRPGGLDVVQVKVSDGVATPVFGLSALLSVLTAADGYVIIPEEATGLDAGTEVEVTLYR